MFRLKIIQVSRILSVVALLAFYLKSPVLTQPLAFENLIYSLNKKPLGLSAADTSYSFLLIGHAYGSPNNPSSKSPASTLIKNLDHINELKPELIFFLGDMVRVATEEQFDNLERFLLSKMQYPALNTPGNHDLSDREFYESKFGKTFQSFQIGSEYFILLNTGVGGETSDEQREFIKNKIELVRNSSDIQNLILLSHRLYWMADPELEPLQIIINIKTITEEDKSLYSFMLSVTRDLENINTYFIAGDIGAFGAPTLFFHRLENENITFLATGLGETEDDAIIAAKVDEGEITFQAISITGKKLQSLEYYSADYWQKIFAEQKTENVSFRSQVAIFLRTYWVWIGFVVLIIVLFLKAIISQREG